jgi:CRP/FNR family transcriptional regulator, cyclic AMP receptor protein
MRLSPEIYERLPEDSMLRRLNAQELEAFLSYSIPRHLARGETLLEQGDSGDSMMIVLSGTLKACLRTPDGREVVLDYIGPGSVIGEMAVFDGKPRAASVVATGPTSLVVLRRRDVLAFVEKTPRAATRIIQVLCDKLRRSNMRMEDSAGAATAARLARALLRLVAEHGVLRGGAMSLDFPISQEELGNYAGLARENVNRHLRRWTEGGVVRTSRGEVTVLDAEALEAIAVGIE